jgi:putative membrane protein
MEFHNGSHTRTLRVQGDRMMNTQMIAPHTPALLAELSPWSPETFSGAVISASVFGLLGIALLLLGFKMFDWITPKIDVQRELAENKNMAVAVVIGAMIIGISIVLARVIGA